ncbi:hypothetical protein DFH09DRAFT_547931 [Mycena vulgaris]|nr:hypothetical protein DFH09DRAFT_547931 [Mycena vulgaris]
MRMHLPAGRPTSPLSIRPAAGACTPISAPSALIRSALSTYTTHRWRARSAYSSLRVTFRARCLRPAESVLAAIQVSVLDTQSLESRTIHVLHGRPPAAARTHRVRSLTSPRPDLYLSARAPRFGAPRRTSAGARGLSSQVGHSPCGIRCTSTRRSTTVACAHGIPHPSTEWFPPSVPACAGHVRRRTSSPAIHAPAPQRSTPACACRRSLASPSPRQEQKRPPARASHRGAATLRVRVCKARTLLSSPRAVVCAHRVPLRACATPFRAHVCQPPARLILA